MRISCCIPKATDKQSEYVILISSLHQQWLRQRLSMLRYAYIACLFVLSHGTHTCSVRGIVEFMYLSVFVVEYGHNCDML